MNLVAPPREDVEEEGEGDDKSGSKTDDSGSLRDRFRKLLASGVALGSVFSTLSEHRIAEDIPAARELSLPPMAWEASLGEGGEVEGAGEGKRPSNESREGEGEDLVSSLSRASRQVAGESETALAKGLPADTCGEGIVAAAAAHCGAGAEAEADADADAGALGVG